MKMNYEKVAGYTLAGLGVLLVGREVKKMIAQGASDAAHAINPANHDNIFSQGINALGDALDDSQDNNSFSLGSWLYDITHPNESKTLLQNAQDVKALGRSGS